MSELLAVLLSYPTVVFTAFLGLALVYWLFVILGAVDVDMFGAKEGALEALAAKGDAAAGMLDAAAAKGEAAAGLLDGAAGKAGVLDAAAAKAGAAEALDGGGDVDVDPTALKGAGGLLHALNLRRAPITVTFSLIVFFAWIASFLLTKYAGPVLGAVMPGWLAGTVFLFGALALAVPLTSMTTRPLERVFRTTEGRKSAELVGTVCRIRTGTVDETFGQASVQDGGAELLLDVRIDARSGAELKRGDRAIIIDYDQERDRYVVEPYDAMLEEEKASTAARR
jgi:hypothetical protein